MSRLLTRALAAWALALCANAPALASPPWERALDHWQAGDLSAAEAALAEAPEDDPAAAALSARLAAARGAHDAALQAWRRAVSLAPEAASFQAGLAESAYRAGALEEAREALSRAASLGAPDPLLGARLERLRGRPDLALDHLRATLAPPSAWALHRERALALADLGLGAAAAAIAAHLDHPEASPEDLRLIAARLWQLGARRESLGLLEAAHLRFPAHRPLKEALASAAAALGAHPLAAATLSSIGQHEGAAEQWRLAGRHPEALAASLKVADPCRRARLRIGLLTDAGDFARALGHADAWGACPAEPAVTLRLAWAAARTGRYADALGCLGQISREDGEHHALAERLRQSVHACRRDPGACL